MSCRIRFFFSILVAISAAPFSILRADLATVYFKDGKTTTIELVGVDRARLFWKQNASASEVNTTLRSEVDSVTFPTTEAWRKAEDARESGRLDEALKLYREVVADPVSNYFPFPGNFVSLAKERMLQCYRLQLDASKVAAQAKIVREEFFHLPPELKRVEPETAAWTAIADENWEKALESLETVETPSAETYYLKARVLEGLGRKEEAVTEYAGAYVLNFGGSVLLTREALRRSSNLVFEIGDPDKTAELQAQVKLYRDLYGKGKLWEGAPEKLAALADGEIKPLGEAESEMTKPEKTGETMAGPVVEESAAVAALAAKEDRDYLLVEELQERFFSTGGGDGEEKVTPNGGVKKEGGSYRFDGTGGFLRLEPIRANTPFLRLRMQFETEMPDGILAHTSHEDQGGFSLYMKGGELLMDWGPREKEIKTATIGKIQPDQLTNLEIVFRADGTRSTIIGGNKSDDTVPKGGLNISQIKSIGIGDRPGENGSGKVLSGAGLPAFKGIVHHFSISTGASHEEVSEHIRTRFGKMVRMTPPPAVEQE